MKFSSSLLLIISALSVKADFLGGLLDTQVVEGCGKNALKVFVTKCVENEVLLKDKKEIYYYEPPKEGEDEVCDRSTNLIPTVTKECAPVQLFNDDPALTSITSFSNEKFNITPYLEINCELEKDSSKKVKDCKGWVINEKSLSIGDVTTTDKKLVGETVKATLTLNIKPDEFVQNKLVVFSYNGVNGFQFAIDGKNKLTMSDVDMEDEETYGYASILENGSRKLTWTLMSKLKKEGEEEKDKVYAVIDAIGINGASVLTVEEAKKITSCNCWKCRCIC